jgi:hypothetical protein
MNFNTIKITLKWILLVGGPLFFLNRAIYMATTGGDHFGTINPIMSWILLLSEIMISCAAVYWGLFKFLSSRKQGLKIEAINIPKMILYSGVASYSVHFIRVAIWISLFVI